MASQPSRNRRIVVEMTPAEAKLLWVVLGNGAGEDAIDCLGLSRTERAKFGRIANRIADAARLSGPRFYEKTEDYE